MLAMVERKGPELRKHYAGARVQSTSAYNLWSVSGQNNPENFEDIFPRLRREPNSGLNSMGKRCIILLLTYNGVQ